MQEKWEIVQKENNSLKGRISQLETEAHKSNEMLKKLKSRNDQLKVLKCQIDKTKKENQKIIAENQFLKTTIGEFEVNDLIRHQELIKQCQKIDKLEGSLRTRQIN